MKFQAVCISSRPSICKFLMKNELLNESLLSIELINEGHIALETGFALKSG